MILELFVSTCLFAGPPPHAQAHGRGGAKAEGVPPGLAKKPGGLPPGLAKKFGRRLPERPYVALDPNRMDRAWFLIGGQWQLKTGLSLQVQAEIRDALRLPLAPPPIPLPKVGIDLHVVAF
ncbi:MAG: hypothetical protein LWX11_07300 [Firmicutes bacterium]|nr:hypothetical protein [Bacillota bacterium]